MKNTFIFLTLAIFSFGLVAFDAEAKRMGGGKSFGKQRNTLNQQAAPRPSQPPASSPTPAGGSKWGGALAGLAAGGLLAALFIGGAFEGINMMDIIMLALLVGAVFFVIRMMRKPSTEESTRPMQFTGMNTNSQNNTQPFKNTAENSAANNSAADYQPKIPADFKVQPFIRNAKLSFIRLQTAHDNGDVNDIREYTTPEMLAEISMQIHERGNVQQKTEVLFLDAHLLDVEENDDMAIASVRFTGQLRDAPDGEPEDFDEIWHVQKDLQDSKDGWLLAGIQQFL